MEILQKIEQNILGFSSNIAIEIGDEKLLYGEFAGEVKGVQEHLAKHLNERTIGLWIHRHIKVYSSVLGIVASGKAYVPLNPSFPVQRNNFIAQSTELKSIIYCGPGKGDQAFIDLVKLQTNGFKVYCFSDEIKNFLQKELFEYQIELIEKNSASTFEFSKVKPEDLAYILFTSGSTGTPKGVPITWKNLNAYVQNIASYYQLTPEDRFSQTFELSFDLSVHDMFLCWFSGGTLCAMKNEDFYFPAQFIQNKKISVWFSVPTLGLNIDKMGMLTKNSFPSLRYSLFCGEALPKLLVEKWKLAAPQSVIENLYGPTEATIAFTRYQVTGDNILAKNGLVAIGKPFKGLEVYIETQQDDQTKGELLLGGDQVALAYWKNLTKSSQAFIQKHGKTWYKTGDLVEIDTNGEIFFLGRIDQQIKYHGHRIELSEIEEVFREACGIGQCVCIPYPVTEGQIEGLVICIETSGSIQVEVLKKQAAEKLPNYMMPDEIKCIDSFPVNSSGKVDRKKLYQIIHSES